MFQEWEFAGNLVTLKNLCHRVSTIFLKFPMLKELNLKSQDVILKVLKHSKSGQKIKISLGVLYHLIVSILEDHLFLILLPISMLELLVVLIKKKLELCVLMIKLNLVLIWDSMNAVMLPVLSTLNNVLELSEIWFMPWSKWLSKSLTIFQLSEDLHSYNI